MEENYIGYIDNEITNFLSYTKRLKRKGILLKCKNGDISKELVVEWLVQHEIKCFLIDYRLKPQFSYEGTDLLFYIKRVLPDLPCIILTNYTEDSLQDNLVEDYIIFDRAILHKTGVFCKTFLHNIAKKKYTPLRLKFFSDYFGLDRAFLSRKLSPVKLKMCA